MENKDVSIPGFGVVKFLTATGTILDEKKDYETKLSGQTRTSSYGGGGSIGTGSFGHVSGYISPTDTTSTSTLSSETVIHQEIWLKLRDGSEQHFKFIDEDIPFRKGQLITIVFTIIGEEYYRVALVNHSSKQRRDYTTVEKLQSKHGLNALSPTEPTYPKRRPIKEAFWAALFLSFGLFVLLLIVLGENDVPLVGTDALTFAFHSIVVVSAILMPVFWWFLGKRGRAKLAAEMMDYEALEAKYTKLEAEHANRLNILRAHVAQLVKP